VQASVATWFAIKQRGVAIDREKQVTETLAEADFRRGTNLLIQNNELPEAVAYLSRASRNGQHSAASKRLWTLFQQRLFWIPETQDFLTKSTNFKEAMSHGYSLPFLDKILSEGSAFLDIHVSADEKRVAVLISDGFDGMMHNNTRVKVFDILSEKPLCDWIYSTYEGGGNYSQGIRSVHLSDDGSIVALHSTAWRGADFLEIWDVINSKQIGDDN